MIRLLLATALAALLAGLLTQVGPASLRYDRIADRTYAVLANGVASSYSRQATALADVLGEAPSLDRLTLFYRLDVLVSEATSAERELVRDRGASPSADVSGCLGAGEDRALAMERLRAAVEGLLGGPDGGPLAPVSEVASALGKVRSLVSTSDSEWSACAASLGRAPGKPRLDPSAWMASASALSPGAVGGFVASLTSSASLAARQGLAIATVGFSPQAVPSPGSPGGSSVLPPTSALNVTVVLRSTGNVDEPGVSLVVSLVPQAPGKSASALPGQGGARAGVTTVSVRADVLVGHFVSVELPTLAVSPGSSYTLEILARHQGTEQAHEQIPFEVAPNPPTATRAAP